MRPLTVDRSGDALADSKSYFSQSQQTFTVIRMDTGRAYIWYLTVITVVKLVEAACFDDCNRETSVLGKASGYCQSCCATCEEVSALQNFPVMDMNAYLLSRHSRTKH